MASTIIEVERIHKRYGDFHAVSDLSFQVYAGEIFALLGPNGAGKSSSIRMILDIIRPDSGRIAVFGGPLSEANKLRLGYLPEERGLYKNAKVAEMMTYFGQLKGLKRADAQKRAAAILEKFALGEFAKKKVSDLSKGMQQKVQFGITVLHEPELIIIDEPFSGLDPVNRIVIKDLLEEMRARGGCVVMSTHQMNQIEEMASRMLMINKGQQALYGTVDEVKRRYALPAVIVRGAGDWASLNSVARSEATEGQRGATTLFLKDGLQAEDLLSEIGQHREIRIDSFERAIPSLDDIFIRVVEAGEVK